MLTTYNTVTYVTLKCWVCGCHFAVDQQLHDNKREQQATLFCPNGCRLSLGETDAAKLRRQLEAKERDLAYQRSRVEEERRCAERLNRSNVSLRGVVTRTKRRIAEGKCPCCHQRFADLHRHMASTHPGYVDA